MAALDDVESRVNQCADTILKASNMAYDTVRHFGNMQQVVSTGQAGALALADTLAAAPVGDAAQVRSNIGAVAQSDLGGLARKDSLTAADVGAQPAGSYMPGDANLMSIGLGGDQWQFRQRIGLGNDDAGRQALGLGAAATRNVTGSGDLMAAGYLGWGGYKSSSVSNVMARCPTGIYSYSPGTAQPSGVGSYGSMLNIQNDAPDWRVKLFFPTYSGRAYITTFSNETWSPVGELMIKGVSCTVDGNGFLKPSSPIMRIGERESCITDRLFFPAGEGATNLEADGATCEKVGEGVYRISGSLGFADDGVWAIETPRDENNQPLLWVNTAQGDDGTITVETYHREHPSSPSFARNKIAGKSDGDPIDIPKDRWIDLRLKMPKTESAE